ncbi:MAG: hypothetical protein P0Y50_09985 [Candidatus Brevundimonas colombiensis]|uniref:DUF3617 family protein n=1 Tax=Candidatus Brevundimonas colombiensis TaxID=3121376 RepID=A0AAJ5X0L1_9CAUL|nr:hypothetical protein [Brevundimonas sp.]WEK38878.1 MAG: hypothetical protein P0Y50_09985 [Brevundimonas sp.]
MKTALFPTLAAFALLSACGDQQVNPPTEPAAPLRTPDAMQPVEAVGPSSLAGRGPRSFVGVWAANPAWCAGPQGADSPITITPMRFDAYGHNCDIARIDEAGSGYFAALACMAQGRRVNERVYMGTTGDVLTLTYMDRDRLTTKLARCPGSPRAPDPANPLEKIMKKEGGDAPPAAPPS